MGERVGLVTTITDCAMTIEEGSILANSLNGETDLEQQIELQSTGVCNSS